MRRWHGERSRGLPAAHRTLTSALCTFTGGKLVYQLAKKKTTHPTCPISGQRLHGVSYAG